MACVHAEVECVNDYELIRKYRCAHCGLLMMCSCDETIGRVFLPHQLKHARPGSTRMRLPVEGGFQARICRECRGLPLLPRPRSEQHGQTSKVRRYYWREITFGEMRLFLAWAEKEGLDPNKAYFGAEFKAQRRRFHEEAVEAAKQLHAATPKYDVTEASSQAVIDEHKVEVMDLHATYVSDPTLKRVRLVVGGDVVDVSEFVRRHFIALGYEVMFLESRPFHALFGVLMWLVIQDPADKQGQFVGFGDRGAFDRGESGKPVWMRLPEDFGTTSYAGRRADAIEAHLSKELEGDLLWMFDYWVPYSADLRNYLWAHRQDAVSAARELVQRLPPATIISVLKYLIGDYWRRYLGWPDFFVYRDSEWFLVEVKSSGDKLSLNQRRWVADNAQLLHLPFKIVRVHRGSTVSGGAS